MRCVCAPWILRSFISDNRSYAWKLLKIEGNILLIWDKSSNVIIRFDKLFFSCERKISIRQEHACWSCIAFIVHVGDSENIWTIMVQLMHYNIIRCFVKYHALGFEIFLKRSSDVSHLISRIFSPLLLILLFLHDNISTHI